MKRGRVAQVAIVALAVSGTLAYSLTRRDVVARPRVAVMTVTPTRGATSTIEVAETTGAAVSVDATVRATWCDPEVTATPSTFLLGGNIAQDISVRCAPLDYFTARRCAFEARDGSATVVAYTGVCLARGTSALTPSALAVPMATRPGVSSPWHAVAFTTPIEMSSASVQLDDQDGIFAVQTPCDTPEGCNDFAEATSAGAPFSLAFSCRPPDTAPHSAHAYVITDTGAEASVRLDCNPAVVHPPAPGIDAALDAPADGSGFFDAPTDIGGEGGPGGDANTDAGAIVDNDGGSLDAGVGSDAGTDAGALPDGGGSAMIALVSPNPLDFGLVQLNATGQLGFTLANNGTQPLTTIQYGSLVAPFSLDVAPTSLAAGAQATGKISCHPTTANTFTQTLHITAPEAQSGSPIDLVVTCGTPPKLVASPTAVTLATPVNMLGTAAVSLANQGASDLVITSVAIVGSQWLFALGAPCGGTACTLPAGQSANVDLMFSPSAIGASNATLVVTSNDPTTPMLAIPLDGTGLGATLALHPGTPATLDLGSIVVGNVATASFQLDNAGNIALTGVAYDLMMAPAAITLLSPPLTVPTTGATVTARCAPTTLGALGALLQISSPNALTGSPVMLNITCTGIMGATGPQLAVSPNPVAVTALVGTPDPVALDLVNTGGMPLTISTMTLAGSARWTLASTCAGGCTLGTNQHAAATVTYTAQAIGASDVAMVTIASNDPLGAKLVMLTGTGQGATLGLAAGTPNPLDFGTLLIGASLQKSIQLQNTGNIQLTGVTYDAVAAPFTLDTAPTTIDVGVPATVRLSCTPTTAGLHSGTLTIHAPNAVGAQLATVQLTCTGQNGGLTAFPTAVDFGEIRAGTTAPVTRTVALSSTAGTLTLAGQPMLTTPVDHLAVGTVATTTIASTPVPFDVVYTPPLQDTAFATSIVATAGNTVTIAVTGKVVTPAIDPAATTTVDAGSWCLGQATGPTTVALRSTGTATLHVQQPTLGASSPFTLTDAMPAMAGYPFTLVPGGAATVTVTPRPSTVEGTVTDMLDWHVDLGAPVVTPITAEFVADRGIAQPTRLTYTTVIGMDSELQLVRLQNCQAQPLAFSGATVTPPDLFTIDTSPPTSLPPGVAAAVGVRFHPQRAGVVTGMLVIETASGPITVELDAVGRGGIGTSGTPDTFYGCGCRSNDPGAPLLVLVVVMMIIMRLEPARAVRRRTRR